MKFFRKNTVSLLGTISIGLILIISSEIPTEAQTLPPDVGLVTQLSGEATYWNEGYQKTPDKVQAFMRIRRGDHFKLSSGATIQLVYFQNGRQETWKGPATFMVGGEQSQVEGDKRTQPEVALLPAEAYQGIRRIPAVVRRARLGRSGGMMVRGGTEASQKPIVPTREERAEIAMAKENYQKMRKQAKADDITPELNLLGVLADYEQYEEMEKVIKEALKIQPDHPVLKELEEWVKTQRTPPPKK
jgi:hypothetical protein